MTKRLATANGFASLFKFFRRQSVNLAQAKRRWLKRTKEPMPTLIAMMPMDVIQRKLRLVESIDAIFVIPREPNWGFDEQSSSMMDHDQHGEFS
jgi:hypothetical protein